MSSRAATHAGAFKEATKAAGDLKPMENTMKKTKAMPDTLNGKRVLDLALGKQLLPPKSFVFELTDGSRLRIFYGRERRSFSRLLATCKNQTVLELLKWVWSVHEQFERDAGSQRPGCPWNWSKVRLS